MSLHALNSDTHSVNYDTATSEGTKKIKLKKASPALQNITTEVMASDMGKLSGPKGNISSAEGIENQWGAENTTVSLKEAKKVKKTPLNFPSQNPGKVKLPEVQKMTESDLDPPESVQDLMSEAKFIVANEIPQELNGIRGQKPKPNQDFLQRRNVFLRGGTGTSTRDKQISVRTALYYAWKEIDLSAFGISNEIETKRITGFIEKQKKECLEAVSKSKSKVQDKNIRSLSAVGFGLTSRPEVFDCSVTTSALKTYPNQRSKKTEQEWWKLNNQRGKALKDRIKTEIKEKIKHDFSTKTSDFGPASFPYKIAYDNFLAAFRKCQEDDFSLKGHYEALNECCRLIDVYYKNNGILHDDPFMEKFCLSIVRSDSEQEAPLYKLSEEAQIKEKSTPINKMTTASALKLETCLKEFCEGLEKKIELLKATELQEKKKMENGDIERCIKITEDYLIKLIKIHKNLSHNRFIDLFTVHTNFINRLQYALSKVDPNMREKLQGIVEKVLSPEVILLETTKHRTTQARHDNKEPADVRNHSKHREINSLVRFLTSNDSFDMVSFEAAHVVPFPALFARREEDAGMQLLPRRTNLKSARISSEFLSARKTDRNTMVLQDIDILRKKNKTNEEDYIDEVLEMLLKVSLEEASHTVHIPSVFNQEIDGASEKHMQVSSINEKEALLLQQNKERNAMMETSSPESAQAIPTETSKFSLSDTVEKGLKTEQEVSKATSEHTPAALSSLSPYTLKVYKYVLGLNIFGMVQERKNVQFEEVVEKEKNYLIGVKLTLAQRIDWVVAQPKTITSLIMACSLVNVFYAIKNCEAAAKKDFMEGEKEMHEALSKLEKWMA